MATLLVIIYVSFISLGLPDTLLGSAWPTMRLDLGLPVSYAGILSMICSGCTILSSFFSAKVIRRFGTGRVTAVSVLMTALALLGYYTMPGFFWLCVLTFPLGLGAGAVDAALNNFVALHYEARHMSWLHCFWGVGATAGPVLLSLFLARENGWRYGYGLIGLIQLVLSAVLLFTLPLWKKTGGEEQKEETAPPPAGLRTLLQMKKAKPALLGFFCYCSLEATTGLWGSSFLVMEKGFSPETAAQFVSSFYLGITIGRFLSGFLTMRLNNRSMIRLGQAVLALGIVLLLLPFGSLPLLPGFLCIGLGCAPIYPCMLHQTPERFGKELSQSFMGIQMACAYVGSTLMPPLFGVLSQATTIALFPFFLALVLLLMIFSSFKVNRTAV